MNRFAQEPEGANPSSSNSPAEDATDLASLYHYPSLGRLFEPPGNPALADMRARLERTSQDLERVIRQGSREDAERATRAASAYKTALALLDELEKLQQQPPGK